MIDTKVGELKPIGQVIDELDAVDDVNGKLSVIKIDQAYLPAMHLMTHFNYFWVLCWFHKADRTRLQVIPKKGIPEYGVFGIRTPYRPNPISLTLVKLAQLKGEEMHVFGLDANQGTPVLDIKPYYEPDMVFSPQTRYVRYIEPHMREKMFRKYALEHHGEACLGLETGLRIALMADRHFGRLYSPDLKLIVKGGACMADVLQGLTRARLANPTRFIYEGNARQIRVIWTKREKTMVVTSRCEFGMAELLGKNNDELFSVDYY